MVPILMNEIYNNLKVIFTWTDILPLSIIFYNNDTYVSCVHKKNIMSRIFNTSF